MYARTKNLITVSFHRTVKPLLSEHQFSITKQVAKNFGAPGGVGAKLQQLLQKKGSAEDNWVRCLS